MRVVRSLDELLRLPKDRYVNGFHTRVPLALEIKGLARPAQLRAQESLNGLQERCGSLAAAAIMFLALLLGVVKVLHANPSLLSWRALLELAAVLIAAFALGIMAQWVALAVTRWQFAHRCREQHRELSRLLQAVAQ
jgi:hypothetical protein